MQTTADITFYPDLDLSPIGTTPTGLPLYRVVKANTRLHNYYDESGAYCTDRIYPHLEEKWILEKWLSAEDFAGTPEAFASADKQLGIKRPYPTDGEYDVIYAFPNAEELALAYLYAKLAQWGKESLSFADRKRINDIRVETEKKRVAQERKDIIADAAPSKFGRCAEKVRLYDHNGRLMNI